MMLTESLTGEPSKSELYVFKCFVYITMAIQQQLHESYHVDSKLRDRLKNGFNINRSQDAFTGLQTRIEHQLIERVDKKRSHIQGTSVNYVAFLSTGRPMSSRNSYDDQDDNSFYGLGHKFGGESKWSITQYVPKQPRAGGIPKARTNFQ